MDKDKEGVLVSLYHWMRSARCLRQDAVCGRSRLRRAGVGAVVSAVWHCLPPRHGQPATRSHMPPGQPSGRLAAGRYALLLSPGDGSGGLLF